MGEMSRPSVQESAREAFDKVVERQKRSEAAEAADDPDQAAGDAPAVAYSGAPIVTIRLQFPPVIEGRRIRGVSLYPPAYSDVQAVAKGEISRADLVAAMSGLPVATIRALRWPDAERVVAIAFVLCPEMQVE